MTSRRQFFYTCSGLLFTASQGTLAAFSQQPAATRSAEAPAAGSSTAKLDAIGVLMQTFLQKSGVTAAQLAICRDGALLYSRAYSSKPPHGFAPADSHSLYRIASCSKLFTCAAIETLRARGKLDLQQEVFSTLNISTLARSKDKHDPLIDSITVGQLVNHAGGWNDHESVQATDGTKIPGTDWDPVFKLREIAIDMGISAAPTKLELARFMYGKALQFVPGTQDYHSTKQKSYSNLGYVLLGLVVEAVSGQPFINFVQNGLGEGSAPENVFVSRLQDKSRDPREVWYTDSRTRPNRTEPLLTSHAAGALWWWRISTGNHGQCGRLDDQRRGAGFVYL